MDSTVQRKLLQYETFLNDVLKNDLVKLEKKFNDKVTEIAEFQQLKGVIKCLQSLNAEKDGFKTKVDLGNNFYIQAKVEDASNILFDVGLGHFVKLNLYEAYEIIDLRVTQLQKQVEYLNNEISKTNAHIKFILIGMRDLQGLD